MNVNTLFIVMGLLANAIDGAIRDLGGEQDLPKKIHPALAGNLKERDWKHAWTCFENWHFYTPDGFSFSRYREGERDILNPWLEAQGFILMEDMPWFTSEGDSFGPLTRARTVLDAEGNMRQVWYG